jgi:hypothetical protein
MVPGTMTRSALIIAVALLAACDGGAEQLSHDEYQDALNAIVRGPDARGADRLFFDLVAHQYPPDACATRARAFHERLQRIVDRVEELDPPDDARKPQSDFVTAARQTVDRIGELAGEVERGELACGMAFNREAYGLASTERARRAVETLQARGYFVFGE